MPDNWDALELCYEALHSPKGIAVEVSNVTVALARLYAARKDSGDELLEFLQFRRSPFRPEAELWITKGLTKAKLKELKERKALPDAPE